MFYCMFFLSQTRWWYPGAGEGG